MRGTGMQPLAATSGAAAADGDAGPDDAVDEIEFQTLVLVRHFELLRRRSDTYAELDRAAYLMLRTLDGSGPMDIGGLAAALGLDRSTAGRQVTAMTAHGLVRTTPSPTDRRRSIISPTSRGHRLMKAVRERRRTATAELLAGWDDRDLHTLSDMFTRYNTAVAERYLS